MKKLLVVMLSLILCIGLCACGESEKKEDPLTMGGEPMSDLKRMSISITEEMERKNVEMRKTDEFCRCSYAEIIRQLIEAGVQSLEESKKIG